MFNIFKKLRTRLFFAGFFNILIVCGTVAGSVDLPCASRPGDNGQGYICVCDSSYCDTVTSPVPLEHGLYHMYKTSNSTPGFTTTTGGFTDSEVPTDNLTSEVVFIVNASTTYQEIIGIGASMTDSSCGNIVSLPQKAQEKLIESYFGPTGIEYSMLRVPIGGTDFSNRSYTLNDFPDDENLESFSLAEEDFNLRIPLLKKAMAVSRRDIKLLACAWAAPAWMKISNTSRPDYISHKHDDVFARYHLKFLEEYHKQGLDVWSISGGNEGMLAIFLMSTGIPSLNFTIMYADIQRDWLKNYLKPYLASSNFSDVKFLTLEDQRMFAPYWMDRIARDAKAYEAVDGIALHWYTDFLISTSVMDELHDKYPDKLILYTETSINGAFGELYFPHKQGNGIFKTKMNK